MIWNWLSKIDPNMVVPVLGGLAAWIWGKASGKKSEAWSKVVEAILSNFVSEIVDRYTVDAGDVVEYMKRVRKYMEDRVWLVLAKRGVPRNSTTEALVHRGIEEACSLVADEVLKIRRSKGLTS